MIAIQPVSRANRHGHSVHDDWNFRAHLFEDSQGAPAIDHEVLGNHLHEIDRDIACKKFTVMLAPQANAEPGKRCHLGTPIWEKMGRRGTFFGGGGARRTGWHQPRSPIVPPLVRHSPAFIALKPWPLQAFWPLHSCSAVAQSELPLQLCNP